MASMSKVSEKEMYACFENGHLVAVARVLYCRWQDEWKYEDFADYKKVMAKALPKGAKMEKMTSRPFKVEFILKSGERKWIHIRGTSASWGGYLTK